MNAMHEFVQHCASETAKIEAVNISYQNCWNRETPEKYFQLKPGFTLEELEAFIKSLDFEYDNGYGGQELFGTIWFDDGTWSTRGEYDGSEWWDYHTRPKIEFYEPQVQEIPEEEGQIYSCIHCGQEVCVCDEYNDQ